MVFFCVLNRDRIVEPAVEKIDDLTAGGFLSLLRQMRVEVEGHPHIGVTEIVLRGFHRHVCIVQSGSKGVPQVVGECIEDDVLPPFLLGFGDLGFESFAATLLNHRLAVEDALHGEVEPIPSSVESAAADLFSLGRYADEASALLRRHGI